MYVDAIKMSTRGSPTRFQGLFRLFRVYRIQMAARNDRFYHLSPVSDQFRQNYLMGRGLQLIGSSNVGTCRNFGTNSNMKNNDKDRADGSPAPSPSPWFNFPLWARWVFGSVLSILLPFWNQKWKKLKRMEDAAELIVEGAETVAEVVENVATEVEKASAEVAEKLPEQSKLKEAALAVEHSSKVAAHDAQVTINLLHKVQEIKQDLDHLEAMEEPVVDKIVGADEAKQPEEDSSS